MSDCPCEEPLNILTNQNNQQQQMNPMQMNTMQMNTMQMNGAANLVNSNIHAMNNLRTNNMMNATNTSIVMPNNNQQQNNNQQPNIIEVPIPIAEDTSNNNKKEEMTVKDQIKIILYIVVALSLHEAIKFFINQSIRLNKGSSSRFLYYPALVIFILVLINLF